MSCSITCNRYFVITVFVVIGKFFKNSVVNLKSAYEARIWFKLHYYPHSQPAIAQPPVRQIFLPATNIEQVLDLLQKYAPQLNGFLVFAKKLLPANSSLLKKIQVLLKLVNYLQLCDSSVHQLMILFGQENLNLLGHFFLQLKPLLQNPCIILLLSSCFLMSTGVYFYINGFNTINRFINEFTRSNNSDLTAGRTAIQTAKVALSRMYDGVVQSLIKVFNMVKIICANLIPLIKSRLDIWMNRNVSRLYIYTATRELLYGVN